ncbi:hypothetical protein HPP92_019044 [Vanilla planifolia]|uniref:Uncharacterized protein n=1 Tax=Vanilla planifolia TaxID=51239 RepID=A0A835Q625_VANPL|nr:hypothetical protein HPP92_019044 [Vanilla planifolia]
MIIEPNKQKYYHKHILYIINQITKIETVTLHRPFRGRGQQMRRSISKKEARGKGTGSVERDSLATRDMINYGEWNQKKGMEIDGSSCFCPSMAKRYQMKLSLLAFCNCCAFP